MRKKTIKIIRFFYGLIPGKIFLLKLLRLFYQPSEFILNQLYFGGSFKINYKEFVFKMKCHNRRGFSIENKLFWYGVGNKMNWEKQSTELWAEIAKKSNVILDIGANTGYYSLLAKAVNPDCKVYGFEPIPHIFNWYLENCKINNFDINCYNLAISDIKGENTIYMANTNQNVYSASLIEQFAISHSSDKVHPLCINSTSLENFIEDNNIESINLIKVDVEGLEIKVLKGMGNFLSKYKPSMLIEVLSDEIGLELSQLLNPLNYHFYILDKLGLPIKTDRISANDNNFFICQKEVSEQLKL